MTAFWITMGGLAALVLAGTVGECKVRRILRETLGESKESKEAE